MKIKLLLIGAFVVLCAPICYAQAPAKKTELTVADRAAWQKVLGWPAELEEQWHRSRTNKDPNQSGLAFHSLGQGNFLVAIEVHESYYQPRYLFMHYSESGKTRPRLLKLKTYEGDDDDVNKVSTRLLAEVEGIPTFVAAKNQLIFHTHGRGTVDCGSRVTYRITPTRAIPVEARVHACFDDYTLGITDPMRWHKVKRL